MSSPQPLILTAILSRAAGAGAVIVLALLAISCTGVPPAAPEGEGHLTTHEESAQVTPEGSAPATAAFSGLPEGLQLALEPDAEHGQYALAIAVVNNTAEAVSVFAVDPDALCLHVELTASDGTPIEGMSTIAAKSVQAVWERIHIPARGHHVLSWWTFYDRETVALGGGSRWDDLRAHRGKSVHLSVAFRSRCDAPTLFERVSDVRLGAPVEVDEMDDAPEPMCGELVAPTVTFEIPDWTPENVLSTLPALSVPAPAHAAVLVDAMLHSPDTRVRSNAARSLGELNETDAVSDLCEALKDTDAGVRGEAAEGLRMLGERKARPCLVELLERESEPWVRENAEMALEAIELGER